MKEIFFMNSKFNLLVCATIVATHWGFTANAQLGSEGSGASGAVYTMTNDASENSVLVYSRNSNGLLTFRGPVSTHGRGSGGILDPLQSQGSVVLSQDGSFLFAANAGSGTITTFRVDGFGLDFVGATNSGGEGPLSIAIHGNLLYVLNIANITGFRILPGGTLSAIPSSTHFLATVGGRDLGDSDIAFNPDGSFLVVTERVANQIVVFPVQADEPLGLRLQTIRTVARRLQKHLLPQVFWSLPKPLARQEAVLQLPPMRLRTAERSRSLADRCRRRAGGLAGTL
jgi:DNA-binding beta-propeller fold protein YncE